MTASQFDDTIHNGLFFTGRNVTNGDSYSTRWSELVLASLRASGMLDNIVIQNTPPTDTTRLWLDERDDPNTLRIYQASTQQWNKVTSGDFFPVLGTQEIFLNNVAAVVADNNTYTAGSIVRTRTEAYAYIAVASGGQIQNAAGQRLDVQPQNGVTPMLALNPAADGSTNDATLINAINVAGRVVDLGGRSYEYGGTFTAVATFQNGRITDDNRTFDYTTLTANTDLPLQQGRCRLQYGNLTSVRVFVPPQIRMAGFRMFGNYYKPGGRQVNSGIVGSGLLDSSGSGLAVETAPKPVSHYAVFAAINDGQAAPTYTQLPFLRAHSVAGSVITLGSFQETDGDTTTADTYAWADNSLVGADVLVITEGGNWNGRVTTVTANTAGTVTLANIGTIAALDKFLIAPPGFDDYVYLGTHMIDTIGGESRNRADCGSPYVGTSGAAITGLPATGEIASYARYSLAGLVPPLATSMKLTFTFTVSTASTGEILHEFSHDSSNHVVAQTYNNKTAATTENFSTDIDIQFSINQEIYIRTSVSGGIGAAISGRTSRIRGYIES